MRKFSKILIVAIIFNLFFVLNSFAYSENTNANNNENITGASEEVIEESENAVEENVFQNEDKDVAEIEKIENSKSAEVVGSAENEVVYQKLDRQIKVNPIYENEVTEADLLKPSKVRLLNASGDCKTIQDAAVYIRNQMKKRENYVTVVYVNKTPLSSDARELKEMVNKALEHTGVPTEGDYILWQYAGWESGGEYYYDAGEYHYILDFAFTYYTTYTQENQMNTAVSNLIKSLNLTGTDYEKITKIYDYICSNITYDYTSSGMLKHTAYAALMNKTSVCQGYAVLFYRLALECGIDNRLVAGWGSGEPHGWNIVKINGYYYNVDSTWDSNYGATKNYHYYMVTDGNFINHVRYPEYNTATFYQKYPMGTSNYTKERNEQDKINYNINGLIWNATDKCYYYYEHGIVTKYTGFATLGNDKWYVVNGKVDQKYNGIAKDSTGTYVIRNNKIATTLTEVMQIEGVWRMVQNGKVNYSYSGIGTNANGTWVLEAGKVTFNYKGLYKDALSGKTYLVEGSKIQIEKTDVIYVNGNWTYVEKGVVRYDYNGIAKNANGTWIIEKGIVTLNYKGTFFVGTEGYVAEGSKVYIEVTSSTNEVLCINGTWRMVKNGVVDYNYNGIGTNANGTWVLEAGKVTFNYKGLYKDALSGKTYLVEGSKVQTGKTDVMYVNGAWTYIENGVARYDYNGIAKNSNGTWVIEAGKVTFNYKGTFFVGTKGYIAEGSKVYSEVTSSTNEVLCINGTWRMVKNGVVDYNYNGIGKNANGTWVLEAGKVTFNYKGLYKDTLSGKTYLVEGSKVQIGKTDVMYVNGAWTYVEKGVVRYDYNGIAKNSNGTWVVEKGIVTFNYTNSFIRGNVAYIAEGSKVYAQTTTDVTEVMNINGTWRMVKNGIVDYNYNGMGRNANGTWVLEAGKVTFNYNKVAVGDDGFIYYVKDSKVRYDITSVMYIPEFKEWTYVNHGKLDYSYIGFAENENGMWFVENGKVTFNYNGTIVIGNYVYTIVNSKVTVKKAS